MSWNLARNTTSKRLATHERAWYYLAALAPDVALVQEVTPPTWATRIWDVVIAPLPSWGWGSAVLAKPELELRPFSERTDTAWDGEALIATGVVQLPVGPLLVGSVHAPLMKPLPVEYLAGFDPEAIKLPAYPTATYYDVPYAIYRQRAVDRFLVAGDWNVSPELWDRHHRNSHEAGFFQRARSDGWVDCYRRFHAEEGRTWFRGSDRPYQMDHAFCDPATAELLTSTEIDVHPAEVLSLSDHAPLIVELGDVSDEPPGSAAD